MEERRSRCGGSLIGSSCQPPPHARRSPLPPAIAWAFGAYLGNVLYDTAKTAAGRMAFGMAQDLAARRIAAVALVLGHLNVSESPRYRGRAIAALATDPNVLTRSGQVLTAGGLACDYGFTDLDGSQPPPFALPGAPTV